MKFRWGKWFLIMLMMSVFAAGSVVYAAEVDTQAKADTKVKAGWYTKKDKTYYRLEDGTTLKKKGLVTIGKSTYYLGKDYSRQTGWKKVKGKYYYFKPKNGKRLEKTGWQKIEKKKYYLLADHSAATGIVKIGKKKYSFSKKGVLEIRKKAWKQKKKWYRTNDKGVVVKVSSAAATCCNVTWKFINKHSDKNASNAARFRACFNWLEAYMPFHYRSFNRKNFQGKDWPYKLAVKMLRDRDGDCHHFACSVASIAYELGYDPYVIVTTGDHSFVQIDGKYYDNMGARFGTSRPQLTSYSVYKKKEFGVE